MMTPRLIYYLFLIAPAFAQQSEFATGRSSYQAGEFKVAVKHFKRALEADPGNAETTYWLGRSYETLADIAVPFGGRYHSLARTYLTKAAELAPYRLDYRRELFDFLVDSGEQRRSLKILLTSTETDPDYDYLRSSFAAAGKRNASIYGRLGKFVQVFTGSR